MLNVVRNTAQDKLKKKEQKMPESTTITVELPAHIWELVNADKQRTGRTIKRIVADIFAEHYEAEIGRQS